MSGNVDPIIALIGAVACGAILYTLAHALTNGFKGYGDDSD